MMKQTNESLGRSMVPCTFTANFREQAAHIVLTGKPHQTRQAPLPTRFQGNLASLTQICFNIQASIQLINDQSSRVPQLTRIWSKWVGEPEQINQEKTQVLIFHSKEIVFSKETDIFVSFTCFHISLLHILLIGITIVALGLQETILNACKIYWKMPIWVTPRNMKIGI